MVWTRVAQEVEKAQGWGPEGLWDPLERWEALWLIHIWYRTGGGARPHPTDRLKP